VSTEEERARLYREQCAERALHRASLCARLAGDLEAAQAVRDAWAPLLPDPSDGFDCLDPPAPARPSWASRAPGNVELPNYLKSPS
jgi:hypothetical protein